MAKQLKQYRYYGNDNLLTEIPLGSIQDGNFIINNLMIVSLGIQSYPGMKFYVNQNASNLTNSIEIGATGIYEIDLNNEMPPISSIIITNDELEKINNDNNKFFIIDIIYKVGG